MDFFLRDGDETRLKNARLADGMDLLYSRHFIGAWGPELVATAMRAGAHVCWYCQEMFEGDTGPKRPVEIRHGYVLVLLHAGCVGKKPASFRTVDDLVRGHQLRREATRIVKGSAALDEVRGESASPLSLDAELFASARNLLEPPPVPPAAPFEEAMTEPLIKLAEGLDTVSPRETSSDNDTP